MAARSPAGGRAARLAGRRAECGVLDHLVDAVRVGESRTLVLCGEPGAGKTALLDYVAGGRLAVVWSARRVSSRRWSWRSPGCSKCARRCWITSMSALTTRNAQRLFPRLNDLT